MTNQKDIAQEAGSVLKLYGASDVHHLIIKDFVIAVGHTVIADQNVTIGLRVDQVSKDSLGYNFKSAICSKEDRFKKDLGEQIVIGRLMTDNENQYVVSGDIDITLSMQAAVMSGMEKLITAMKEKQQHDKQIDYLQNFYNKQFSRALEGLV